MKKADNTEDNREKFFSGLPFQVGNETARFQEFKNSNQEKKRILEVNGQIKQEIKSVTDHSFSFLFSYFGQVNLITVFFSELVFIPDEYPGQDPPDENFLISNQL